MTDMERIEREAVERVLAFANLRRVTDPEAVYALLEGPVLRNRLAVVSDEEVIGEDGVPQVRSVAHPLLMQRLLESSADAARILSGDLRRVAMVLRDLADSPRKARTLHRERIAALLGKGALLGVPTFERGRVQVELRYVGSGVEAACGYGLALLYDASKPYRSALARCPLAVDPENDGKPCHKWLLRLPRNNRGPSQVYCCKAHQRAADKIRAVQRAREWRDAP